MLQQKVDKVTQANGPEKHQLLLSQWHHAEVNSHFSSCVSSSSYVLFSSRENTSGALYLLTLHFLCCFCLFSCLFSLGRDPFLWPTSTTAWERVGCVCRPSEGVAQPSDVVVRPSRFFWSCFDLGFGFYPTGDTIAEPITAA